MASMNATRWRLLSQLAESAGHGQPLRLANGSQAYKGTRGGRSQVVYGLAQCTGDLAPSECTWCLMNYLTEVSNGATANFTSGSFKGFSCYLRYQVNDPIDIAGPAAPAPSPQPPAAPPSGAAPPPTGSKTPLIAGLAAAASSTVMLLAIGV